MSSRTLIDISRLGTDTTWPSVAVEVNGYLQNWIAAANAQVSQHQLRIATAPNPDATATDPCGWRIEATLSQLTPGGNPAVLILEVFLTGTSLRIMPGIGNSEPFVGADNEQGWIYPSATVGWASGDWSTTPLPFNAQVGWSLAPGAEYFVFAYSQHRFTNRQAVPLLIARDQVSGHWILAASPPSTTTDDGRRRTTPTSSNDGRRRTTTTSSNDGRRRTTTTSTNDGRRRRSTTATASYDGRTASA